MTNCNKSRPDQVSAPLILDPTAGSLSKDIKEVTNVQAIVASDGKGWHCQRGPCQSCKSKPFYNEKCRNDCFHCEICDIRRGNCKKNQAGYEVVCVTSLRAGRKTCYYGESSKNGYTRGGEHRATFRLKNEENAWYKHCLLEHDGMQAEFSSCLVMQANEAVRTHGLPYSILTFASIFSLSNSFLFWFHFFTVYVFVFYLVTRVMA